MMLRLENCMGNRLARLATSEDLHIIAPAGIGDVMWVMSKFHALIKQRESEGQRVTVHLPEGEQQRAGAYLEMIGVHSEYMPALTTRWVWDRDGSPRIPVRGWISVQANAHLEQGRHLRHWYPGLPWKYPRMKTRAVDSFARPFVLGFMCTSNYMMGQLEPEAWRVMIGRMEQDVAPVRLIGAGDDCRFIEQVVGRAPRAPHIIDQPLEYVLAAMRNPLCRGAFGVAGGPLIMAITEGVPTFMFYPAHLAGQMPGTWEPAGSVYRYCELREALYRVMDNEVGGFLAGGHRIAKRLTGKVVSDGG